MLRRNNGAQVLRGRSGRWAVGLVALGMAVAGLVRAADEPKPADPPKEAGRTDLHGDPLPAGALTRLGTLRWRHDTPVTYLAFLADGKAMLTSSLDDRVRLWDIATGKELLRWGKEPGKTGTEVGIVGGHFMYRPTGFFVVLAPDGKTLATVAADNFIRLRDVPTGKVLRSIKVPTAPLTMLLFSSDGETLAGRLDLSSICLWDAVTGKERCRLTLPVTNRGSASIHSMAFSPDNKVLTAGVTIFEGGKGAFALRSWDATSGKELRQVSTAIPAASVHALAFAPDGKTLAYTEAGPTVHVCEAATGKETHRLQGPGGQIFRLAYSPDGKALTVEVFQSGRDSSAYLLDLETGKVRLQLGEIAAFGGAVAFSRDGKLVATGGSSAVRLWDTATGKEVSPAGGHHGHVTSLTISPEGLVASKGSDNIIRLWDVSTGKERSRFTLPEGTTCAALAPDGRLAALGNTDGSIRLHETATGKELHRLKGHPNPAGVVAAGPRSGVCVVAFSGDSKVLASRGFFDNTIRLYEAATGKEFRQISLPKPWPPAPPVVAIRGCPLGSFGLGLALSPDGQTVASPVLSWLGENGPDAKDTPATLRLWDAASGKEIRRIVLAPEQGFENFAFAPDGRTLAVENWDQTVSLWEVASGRERARLGATPPPAQLAPARQINGGFAGSVDTPTIAFAPDGRTLAVKGVDSSIRLWDVRTGKERKPLKGHDSIITALAFSPDGGALASTASDTTILLWDMGGPGRELQPPARELPANEIGTLWGELAGDDARKAFQGIRKLADAPRQTIPMLRERLRPAAPVDPKKIAKWIADLDSDEFAVRQRAEQELEKLGELAVPALAKRKAEPSSPETKRRAERLLEKVTIPTLSTEQLRLVRALEVLEQADTAEARRLLEELAKGAPGALSTREAQAALDRLARRPAAR